jgi:hypothetical protein
MDTVGINPSHVSPDQTLGDQSAFFVGGTKTLQYFSRYVS